MLILIAGLVGLFVLMVIAMVITLMVFRRVVPTNMVHIVQSSKRTTSFGKGQESGNTYYAWPASWPVVGVTVTEFPESIFQVSLANYEAYDTARLPFMVDVSAFFRISDSTIAAHRVSSFEELHQQLDAVLKGAVRRILATNPLEHIMEARSELGVAFTSEVTSQIKEWGVTTVKSIEFMDLRDSKTSNSQVIHNIMAKEQSRIDRESRIAVADNKKAAELAEIDAKRTTDVQQQDAMQQVGIRTAEKDKTVGLAKEMSSQEIQTQAAITAEKLMAVEKVKAEKQADIEKQVSITIAEGERQVAVMQAEGQQKVMETTAEGNLAQTIANAKGVKALGEAEAEAERLKLMAPVAAQAELAQRIGENQGYQTYLITIENVKASSAVGIAMANALAKADLKIISAGGGQGAMLDGASSLADMFTAKGGVGMASMLSTLAATDEGKALISKFSGAKDESKAPAKVK